MYCNIRRLFKFGATLLLATSSLWGAPLDDYVNQPDSHYRWTQHKVIEEEGCRLFAIELWSQKWRSEEEVDRPVWHHWLFVAIPDTLRTSTGMMRIASGSNGEEAPFHLGQGLTTLAKATGSIVAEVRMIPNQKLRFHDEKDERYQTVGRQEDELVAYTWDKYFATGEAGWLARFPMTKAVVRAMDATQELAKSQEVEVKNFVLVGASKRGWTAWTVAGVDQRVVGVIPLVIDMLNLKPSMEHHFRTYGQWALALKDYIEMGVHNRWSDPKFDQLLAIEEPYAMRDRLTMPKYIINAASDEFFLPDSSQFYFADLPGHKYLRYVPNTGHWLKGSGVELSVAAFYTALLAGEKLPQYSWGRSGSTLQVATNRTPVSVLLWQAHNPKARDFRLPIIGEAWKSTPLNLDEAGQVTVELPSPEEGWTASFVELTYKSEQGLPLTFTTEVFVTPSTLPFEFSASGS
jgi:PhoPQ-activated pathogenicity-related protein